MINWGLLGAILTPNVGGWLSTFPMRGQVKRPDGKAWYQLLNNLLGRHLTGCLDLLGLCFIVVWDMPHIGYIRSVVDLQVRR